jgi:N-methylhydantoinase B/oxoprolinase/acetone carboxylase alpha subunit
MTESITDEQTMVENFLGETVLFLGPDPEIMTKHGLADETVLESKALASFTDPEQVNLVRHKLQTACNESFDMVEQMGAAPGAKWGDLVTCIFSGSGDLAMASAGGVLLFSVLAQHPVKFVLKYWADEPTVGINEGDIFMHNDARYGNIHNTDQSLFIPVFHEGQLICFAGAIVHEGENGACEPGGMPAKAESPYDEGLKMSPLKVGENFQFRRDIMTFLQNCVRDPALQLEGMKAKLYASMRIKERIKETIAEYGVEAVVATVRRTLTDTADEVRRRLRMWPDGTIRQNIFPDSTLRENCLIKLRLEMTKKGDRMILDFRGSSPQFLNRPNNTVLASMKGMLAQEFLSFVWPDLPRNQAVFAPMEVITDKGSTLDCSPDAPNAQSMMTFFPAFSAAQLAVPKLLYSAGERSTDILAGWYNMISTFIYGGITQHGAFTGNLCADVNGMGGGARWNRDGEHALAPTFCTMADLGEHEVVEEEVPMMKFVANKLTKDVQGFGKFRGGMGYQQIVTVKDSPMWGFQTAGVGAKFPSTHGLFGGYGPGCYPLSKIKNVDIFKVMKDERELLRYSIEDLMNDRPFPDATYSTHPMGMLFEFANRGELYMISQGTGGGYGDVLERDPELVATDFRDGLISEETARELYHVILAPESGVVDAEATEATRKAEREARLARGKPFAEFVAEWETELPPADVPYFGSWNDPEVLHLGTPDQTCPSNAIAPVMMPDPNLVRIAALEAEIARLRG